MAIKIQGTTVIDDGRQLNVIGVNTISNVEISSGIVTAVSGVVTYYGDGSNLDGIQGGAAISTNTTNQAQYIPYATSFGSTTGFGATTLLVYNPSTTSLGIGTTSPDAALHVVDDILVSTGVAATLDIRIKVYSDEGGSISFEDAVDESSIFTLQQGDSDILFDVSTSPTNQVFQVGVDSSIIISSGVSTADFKIKAYGDELGAISFEDAVNATQYFSITQDLSTILFGVNDASLNTKFVVDASGNVGIQTDTVGASRALDVYGNANINGNINVSGISTLNSVQISSGIVTAVSGIVTYYGDGSNLDNTGAVISPGSGIQRLVITGLGTVGVLTNVATKTDLVFDSTNTSLGIGTTSPDAALHVVDDILVSTGVAATLDIRIKVYSDEGGSISFEDAVDESSIFTLQQGDSDILFDVSTSPTNQVFQVGPAETKILSTTCIVNDSITISSGVSTADFKIKAYDDELGAISFEDATDATQYFSITQDLSTTLFGVNNANFDTVFTVNANSSTNVRFGSVAEKLSIIDGNTVNITYESSTGTNIGVCTNPTGDITLNVTNIPTTSDFDNCSLTFSVFVLQGTTARKVSSVNLNGVSKTIRWPGGIAGTGNTSCYDIFNFVGINTIGSASTTSNYDVLGQVNEDFRLY